MDALTVINPATGETLAEVAADNADTIAAKASRARAAQPAFARMPLDERRACIRRFRGALESQLEVLATTLTREVGKPITQSRNEI